MNQLQIHRQVALATGESIRTIKRRGFSLVDQADQLLSQDRNHLPQLVDWDVLDAQRRRSPVEPRRPGKRAC